MHISAIALIAALPFASAAIAAPTPHEIETAMFDGSPMPRGQTALTVKAQVLLDRAGISPGVIDGYKGGMSESAIRAFEEREGFEVDGVMDEEVWAALTANISAPITEAYRITEEDAVLTPDLPTDYAELAQMERIDYERISERLAERFHMDEDFLRDLNPDAEFVVGETIMVTYPGRRHEAEVVRVTIDGETRRLRAYDADGNMVASYPVAVGSEQTPSPEGVHEVVAVATEPTYSYRPDENFQQGSNKEPLTLPPGANGPVGLVWIDLSEETYGIHGTPEPARLFQESSHGCVRMTNWDAQELAYMVSAGVEVEFLQ